ncbi:ribosome recycling factor [Buchnera aphidicola (Kurisakia onigurumii)]|uniref:ribosome recycling factor n=1 Tax=Buchnera aphidicola TaxID=9 RepID=UPI0031B6E4DC
MNEIITFADLKMQKCINSFKTRINAIRTSHATPELLNNIFIDYYGKKTPLFQVTNIVVENSRTLKINIFENGLQNIIQKSIINANLGYGISTQGNCVYVTVPHLNEERRQELVKKIKKESEQARICIRIIRKEKKDRIKLDIKKKIISKDQDRVIQKKIQDLTDKYIKKIEKIFLKKESDIMKI